MGLTHAVERTLRRHAMLAGGETVLVAVSGGADSVALLHLLHALAPAWRLRLHVLHVDHGLRPDSAADAGLVRALGARLGVEVDVARVRVGAGSVEAAARAARYEALEASADRVGAARIAVGHTADDQAETVLMRVLGGAGVRGLAAIPPVRGRIIRPLIGLRRDALRRMLREAGVAWVEDPTNRDPKFLRNRIRHELLPLLAACCGPDVVPSLARVARLARETVHALDHAAAVELDRLAVADEHALTLSREALAAL
ncbi:MAG TPA: tRNA lysidine(34) synthetase TilS, partial [Methylomirabilota bacterium]|nr:tRNA lysidine(34) synthetase TilS [Methylomirabilota bacterium]